MKTAILAAMMLASGPAFAGAGGLTLACKGKFELSLGSKSLDWAGSVALDVNGKQLHISGIEAPCKITKVTPTSVMFACPEMREASFFWVDAVGTLDRISGDLFVNFRGKKIADG